nr:hypothetical protein [Candidatus Woesearchaeota archaeon]
MNGHPIQGDNRSFLDRNWWWILIVVLIFLSQTPPEKPFGSGESCINDSECISGRCTNNLCDVSKVGEKCYVDGDCKPGFCVNNECKLSSVMGSCHEDADCENAVCSNNKCVTEGFIGICESISFLIPYKIFIWLIIAVLVLAEIQGLMRSGSWRFRDFQVSGPLGFFVLFLILGIITTFIC